MRPRVHRSLSRGWKTCRACVLVNQLSQEQGGSGEAGEQFIEEVFPELTNDLIKNVHVPDVGCDGTFICEVSSGPALEAGPWEHVSGFGQCPLERPLEVRVWEAGQMRPECVRVPEPEIHPLYAAEVKRPEAGPEGFRSGHS
jgi:hypothetical protein